MSKKEIERKSDYDVIGYEEIRNCLESAESSVETVPRLGIEFDLHVDGSDVEECLWLFSRGNERFWNVESDFALAGLDSIVAIVVDVELRVNGHHFGSVSGEKELAERVGSSLSK